METGIHNTALIGCVFCLLFLSDVSLMKDEDFILPILYFVIRDDAHLLN